MKNPRRNPAGADVPHGDELLLQRLLDGELEAPARAEVEARIGAEPALRQRFEMEQALRAGFRTLRAQGRTAPASFTASVVAAVRRLPSRSELVDGEEQQQIRRLCRRVLIAALALLGLGLAVHAGLLDRGQSNTLQAAPDEIQREMDRLDALIQGGILEAGGASGASRDGGNRAPERAR